ncbi:hypothetical protein [Nonomuraea sp. NPDC050643]|uniref:hypothetical protein n=1 Tax=Nonomuraea sp. NPDC050643 TaxID=3155660 RepID=UPI0033D7412D
MDKKKSFLADVVPEVASKGIKLGAERLATDAGARYLTHRLSEAYLSELGKNLLQGAGRTAVLRSAAAATVQTGSVRHVVGTLAPIGGKLAGGALAGPAVEILTLWLDDEEHTGKEYARASGRGLASGLAGAAATAAVCSVVPGAGTFVGFVAGLAAGTLIRRLLNR